MTPADLTHNLCLTFAASVFSEFRSLPWLPVPLAHPKHGYQAPGSFSQSFLRPRNGQKAEGQKEFPWDYRH